MSTKFRQGSALVMVILMATCLGILSLSYFRATRENRHSGQWFGHRCIAREAAQMIHEESFASLLRDCRDRRSQLFWFLLGAVSGAQNDFRLPFSRQNIARILPDGFDCEFSSQLKVVSFKKSGPDGNRYMSANEGHGILAIITRVEIFKKGSEKRVVTGRHYLEIHHDYLVASVISSDKAGSRLKNALLVRKNREFDRQNIVNTGAAQLLIYQTERAAIPESPEFLKVYSDYSLWARRNLSLSDLERLKIIDAKTKTINLSGINHCREAVVFDGAWQIRGQGVLIADSFAFNDSIKKAGSDDLAVFYARRGKITINTSNEIHAALIAVNNNYTGSIESSRALNLNGLIICDRLNIDTWGPEEHVLVYDRAFSDNEKAYQINVSRWVNYRRSSEKS